MSTEEDQSPIDYTVNGVSIADLTPLEPAIDPIAAAARSQTAPVPVTERTSNPGDVPNLGSPVPHEASVDTTVSPVSVPKQREMLHDGSTVTLRNVSISFTVLLLFTPVRYNMKTKKYHPCYIEKLNYNIPDSARINSLMNSLCDNIFQIGEKHWNPFGLGSMGYDLFFFEDKIPLDDEDPFKLVLTERSNDRNQHTVGLRFKKTDGTYENTFEKLKAFIQKHEKALKMHLVTVEDLVTFRKLIGIEESSHKFDADKPFQECFLATLLDFQDFTDWREGAMNGQNRMACGLAFCVGCNFDIENWALKPRSINSLRLLDEHISDDDADDDVVYKIYSHPVGIVPQQKQMIDYINRARENSKLTDGVRIRPPLELRVLSPHFANLFMPSVSVLIDEMNEISKKRAVDERMLSSTSMPAKFAAILSVICEEMIQIYKERKEFHTSYQGAHCDPPASFKEQYPDYRSESDVECEVLLVRLTIDIKTINSHFSFSVDPPAPVRSKKSPSKGKKKATVITVTHAKKPRGDAYCEFIPSHRLQPLHEPLVSCLFFTILREIDRTKVELDVLY